MWTECAFHKILMSFQPGTLRQLQGIAPVKAGGAIALARNNRIKLEQHEGYGETSVRNLFGAIENRRRISLERFIFALGMQRMP
jgi:NAD-dependent DNA ligase